MIDRKQASVTFIILLLLTINFWVLLPIVKVAGEEQEPRILEIPSVIDTVEGSWDLLWKKLKALSRWDLEYYDVTWQSRKDLLTIIKDFPEPNVCKITLDFTSDQAGSYRLTFAIDKVVRNYVERASVWQYNLTYDDFSIIFDWSDAKDISGLQFSHGVTANFFWFRMRRDNVPADYNVLIDPSVIGTSLSQGAVGYPYLRKSFWAKGLHWVFYCHLVYYGGMDDAVTRYATSPDGETWTLHNSFGVYHSGSGHFSVFYNGSHIVAARHAVEEGGPLPTLWWRIGEPQADGSITWTAAWQAARIGDETSYDLQVHVIIDDQGYSWIGTWNRVASTWYLTVYKNGELDGTWVSAVGFPANIKSTGSTPAEYCCLVPLTDGKVYALMGKNGETTKGKLWNGTHWSGQETVSGGNMFRGHSMSGVGDADDTVHFVYYQDDNDIRYRPRDIVTGWGAEVTIETVVGQDASPCISIHDSADDLYVFYYENSPAGVYYVKYTGSWQAKASVEDESIYQYYLSCFYKMYDGAIGVCWTKTNATAPYNVKYSFVFDAPCRPEAFYIENINAYDSDNDEGWLFAEDKYYIFNAMYSRDEGTAALKRAYVYFLDGADRNITIYFDFTDNSSGVICGQDYAYLGQMMGQLVRNEVIVDVQYVNVTWPVFIRAAIIDKQDVDFYLKITNIYDLTSGWENRASGYGNIYSRGGLTSDAFMNDAGRLPAGDAWNLYCANDSLAYNEVYYRSLQHFKLLADFVVRASNQSVPRYRFGIDYYARGKWNEFQWYLELKAVASPTPTGGRWEVYTYWIYGLPYVGVRWVEGEPFLNDRWILWNVSVYQNDIVTDSQLMYAFYETDNNNGTEGKLCSTFWIDLWVNRINASSTVGARATAAYYAMATEGGYIVIPGIWTVSGTWEAQMTNSSSFVRFGKLLDEDTGDVIFAKEIELVRMWFNIQKGASSAGANETCSLQNINVFDLTITTGLLEGIPTPTFEDTRTKAMPLGGWAGWLASALANIFKTAYTVIEPLVTGLTTAAISMIDGLLFSAFGRENVIASFMSTVRSTIGVVMDYLVAIPTSFAHVGSLVINTFNWVFTSIFSVVWGITNFLLANPVFNIWGGLSTITGVSYAWLAGTSYTNAAGQVFDFTYLSSLQLGTASGGIVVFILVFIAYFFMSFAMCLTTLSLDPILAAPRLLWGFTKFAITIMGFMWNIAIKFIPALIKLVYDAVMFIPRLIGFG